MPRPLPAAEHRDPCRSSLTRARQSEWCGLPLRRDRRPERGAKVGANVHSYQAMPGDVQPALTQVNGTPDDMGLGQATEQS